MRTNFAEVNLAIRGGDKTAVRRRRTIRREIYEVQAVPYESVGVMHAVGSARRVIARLRCPRLINRATVRLNTGDVIIRGFMRRCAGNFLNNPDWSFLPRANWTSYSQHLSTCLGVFDLSPRVRVDRHKRSILKSS